MKKLFIFSILTYLLISINSRADNQDPDKKILENEKVLKIGVLLPLTGDFKDIGQSLLKTIQLALFDLGEKNVKIYLKDSKANAIDTYLSAKELEKIGVQVVIGPIFYESLEKLSTINNITFIALTNKINKIPKNTIAFGVNINSQINALKEYFEKNKISKTVLLSPKNQFMEQTEAINNSKLEYYKASNYDTDPKKITQEIEKLTNYYERKKDLERRIKILGKSDLQKDKRELKKLEQRHTLGKINFDSVIIVDFGERLKSVLSSFSFVDISNENVDFFTLNQWFDESLFKEKAYENLYFPTIDLKNFTKFRKKYFDTFNEMPIEISILAYDAIGLIYLSWVNNKKDFKLENLYTKNGFKGMQGEFIIRNNLSYQKLEMYKISNKKFVKVN